MTTAAQVWGMSEGEFLALYGTAVVAYAVFCFLARGLGSPGEDGGAFPELDVHELAMLAGGPKLAITVAAASLHRDGRLHAASGGELTAAGLLPAGAHGIEREVFDAVAHRPRISGRELRRQVRGTDTLTRTEDALRARGLRLQGGAMGVARMLWLVGALLWLAALARVIAVTDSDVEATAATWILIPVLVTWFKEGMAHRPRHRQSARGRELLGHLRDTRAVLRESPRNEAPVAAALFGAAILWDVEPDLAQALGLSQSTWTEWDWDWVGDGDCGGCGGCG